MTDRKQMWDEGGIAMPSRARTLFLSSTVDFCLFYAVSLTPSVAGWLAPSPSHPLALGSESGHGSPPVT